MSLLWMMSNPLPSPIPRETPSYTFRAPIKARVPMQEAVVFGTGEPIEEVLRFTQDGSIYLRGRLVGQDPAIAHIVKQESEGRQ